MSRSKRKNPIRGVTSITSERPDKQAWHRNYRKAVRQRLAVDSEAALPHLREFHNPWRMGKDGKRYFGVNRLYDKYLRK